MFDMTEWIKDAFTPAAAGEPLPVTELLLRLLMALVLGAVIALVYRLTQRPESPAAPTFIATLVMLCILLAMVTQIIGNSPALAFSLVGILSIVRFRTTVEDTRDTAFVIFVVIVGMATGVGNYTVSLVGLAVVAVAAFSFRLMPAGTGPLVPEWTLQLRVSPGAGAQSPWDAVFAQHCERAEITSTSTARQGAALDLSYRLRLRAGVTPMQLLNEINRLEGIQNVEMKRV